MLKRSLARALTLLLCSQQLAAQCLQPQRPPPVDAKSQDAGLLQVTYRAARQFLGDADAFLRCIKNTERELMESGASDDNKETRRRMFHATVDDIRAVNANLEKQSKIYLQRSGASLESTFPATASAATDNPATGTAPDDQNRSGGTAADATPLPAPTETPGGGPPPAAAPGAQARPIP